MLDMAVSVCPGLFEPNALVHLRTGRGPKEASLFFQREWEDIDKRCAVVRDVMFG